MELTSISSSSYSYLERYNDLSNSSNVEGKNETTEKPQEKTVSNTPNNLSEEEKREVEKLKKIDREVKAHEAAHIAAGGSYVRGGAVFSYQTGPDGKRYAVSGEVSIDTSPVPDNPEATIQKMQVVKRAAMAPANPSAQDRAVAASAAATEAQARMELLREKREEKGEDENKEKIKINKKVFAFEKIEKTEGNNLDLLA